MSDKLHAYENGQIKVTYDAKRCIHFAACVRGLPKVFNPMKRPWVMPDEASADQIADVVERCPTGALHYERKDGGAAEATDVENSVLVSSNGPIYARGELEVMGPYNQVQHKDTRLALCRCGFSRLKPYCDGSHTAMGFKDPAVAPPSRREPVADDAPMGGPLRIDPNPNGPLVLRGNLRLMDGTGEVVAKMTRCILCRCGQSREKPFCDGSHATAGFVG
ncbi:MAG TPA: CDGSH iron-sulfur domain-containing protein [Gemmatimonadales bacterium]|nr:CDGSH iron-sulfur domain-containing protein [Gemmatimonadales bacterium]